MLPGGGVGARGARAHRAVGERRRQQPAPERRAHLQRAGRAALRLDLGHRRRRPARSRPARRAARRRPGHARRAARAGSPEGWYLVYWRVISVDGHPVRGAFTFAVGPNPGPAPQFVDPVDLRDRGDAAARRRPLGRCSSSVMAAIGLFVLRLARSRGRSCGASAARACGACRSRSPSPSRGRARRDPVYLAARDRASSRCARRSTLGALVPLLDVSAFGRGFLELELCFALFVAAARGRDLASTGPSASTARSPSCSRSPARCSPRRRRAARPRRRRATRGRRRRAALALALDWRAPGGGLDLARRADRAARALARACRRAPGRRARRRRAALLDVALVVVLALIAHRASARRSSTCRRSPRCGRPATARRCWSRSRCCSSRCCSPPSTCCARGRASAARERPGSARRRRGCCAGSSPARSSLVGGAFFAAALLTSLAPPAEGARRVGKRARARSGPGPATSRRAAQRLHAAAPRRAEPGRRPNDVHGRSSRADGRPVRGADVIARLRDARHGDGPAGLPADRDRPGVYCTPAPALVMVGHWGLTSTSRRRAARRSTSSSSTGRPDEREPRDGVAAPRRGAAALGAGAAGRRRRPSVQLSSPELIHLRARGARLSVAARCSGSRRPPRSRTATRRATTCSRSRLSLAARRQDLRRTRPRG